MLTKSPYKTKKVTTAHHPVFARQNPTSSFVPPIQTKLEVGSVNSVFETEADNMADRVVQNRSLFQATSFIPPHREGFQTVTQEKSITEENPEELANAIMPPVEGKRENPNETAERNPPEEKPETEQPDAPDEKVETPRPPEPDKGKSEEPPVEAVIPEKASEKEENQEVTDEEAAVFQGKPKMEPVAPIEITPALTESVSLVEDTQEAESEIEEPENAGGLLQAKFSSSNPEDLDGELNGVENQMLTTGTGQSLPTNTLQFMEDQFHADFSDVRVHTGAKASSLNNKLRARAFTHSNNIYFNQGQYDPVSSEGQHLLAHELTHTMQQGAVVQRKPTITSTHPKIQRWGIGDALDYFADKAYHIPGYRMFTIILGVNPINMSSVDRSAGNILRAMVEFLPGGYLITQALENHGIFTRVSGWFKEQMDSLGISGSSIRGAINRFLDSLSWSDIFDLGDVWRRAKAIFTTPIKRLISFAKRLVRQIMDWVKEAILRPIALLAEGTPAYDLLRVVLGSDPITGDPYPPTADNLIGGFMKLIGQDDIWENIKKGNAVERAFLWFQGALSGLMNFVTSIPLAIINSIKSLTWDDIILVPKAFIKIGKAFLNVAGKFISWAGGTVLNLLEILFSVVAPPVVPWLKKAGGAFSSILQNPVGFIGNLVRAAKNGFMKFARNIAQHLKAALINWLMGSLAGAGVYIPQSLGIKELIKFVLSVLGISWANLRLKLVKHLGEPAVKALETGFEMVHLLLTKGPIALWERLKEQLADLKSMVIGEISSWVVTKVVMKGITKLVSSLNPAGAVIQAILFIYDTITFLIDKISQIAQVGMAVLNSVSAIAGGAIQNAVQKVEETLARILNLAIGFLAKFLGLGKISDKIVSIVKKVQKKVDKALDHVVGWIVGNAKKFLKKIIKKDDESKHGQYASEAVTELSKPSNKKDYKEVREEKIVLAKTLENRYKTKLKKGIKMTIKFEPKASDKKDQDIDFTVIIAPNATKKKGESSFGKYTQDQVPVITVYFNFNPRAKYAKIKGAEEEYKNLLAKMQEGVNQQSLEEWIRNRAKFLRVSEIRKGVGKSPSSDELKGVEDYKRMDDSARESQRELMAEAIADEMFNEYLNKQFKEIEAELGYPLYEVQKQQFLSENRTAFDKKRKHFVDKARKSIGKGGLNEHATHTTDKVGGGAPFHVRGLGPAGMNSSIGSQLNRDFGYYKVVKSNEDEDSEREELVRKKLVEGEEDFNKFYSKLTDEDKNRLTVRVIYKLNEN